MSTVETSQYNLTTYAKRIFVGYRLKVPVTSIEETHAVHEEVRTRTLTGLYAGDCYAVKVQAQSSTILVYLLALDKHNIFRPASAVMFPMRETHRVNYLRMSRPPVWNAKITARKHFGVLNRQWHKESGFLSDSLFGVFKSDWINDISVLILRSEDDLVAGSKLVLR